MEGKQLIILDGGNGHLLKQRGVETSVKGLPFEKRFLAVAIANREKPDDVRAVHLDYIDAGADVITVNNYALTPWSLARIDRQNEVWELTEAAALLACEAAKQGGKGTLVAGSLPPLQESYQPQQGVAAFEVSQPTYEEMSAVLTPHVSLLLCETMSSVAEGLAAASAASASGKPFWVSWTLDDSEDAILRSGETLQSGVESVSHLPGLEAVLVNCCAPQSVTAALPVLHSCVPPHVRIGGYANGFRETTSKWLSATGNSAIPSSSREILQLPVEDYDDTGLILPEAYLRHAQKWVQLGASIIGGCCGVGPEHIRKLHGSFSKIDNSAAAAAAAAPERGL